MVLTSFKKIGSFNSAKDSGLLPLGDRFFLTLNPIHMMGCGTGKQRSSYSPESKSFLYLITLVCQPYCAMLFRSPENYVKYSTMTIGKEKFYIPVFDTRCFVFFNKHGEYRCQPSYGSPIILKGDEDSFSVSVNTPPPLIHLDDAKIYPAGDGHTLVSGKAINSCEYGIVIK